MTRSEFHAILYIYIYIFINTLGLVVESLHAMPNYGIIMSRAPCAKWISPFVLTKLPTLWEWHLLNDNTENRIPLAHTLTIKRFLYVWNLGKWSWCHHQLCEINTSRSEITTQVKIEKHNLTLVESQDERQIETCDVKISSVRNKPHLLTWSLGMIEKNSKLSWKGIWRVMHKIGIGTKKSKCYCQMIQYIVCVWTLLVRTKCV